MRNHYVIAHDNDDERKIRNFMFALPVVYSKASSMEIL